MADSDPSMASISFFMYIYLFEKKWSSCVPYPLPTDPKRNNAVPFFMYRSNACGGGRLHTAESIEHKPWFPPASITWDPNCRQRSRADRSCVETRRQRRRARIKRRPRQSRPPTAQATPDPGIPKIPIPQTERPTCRYPKRAVSGKRQRKNPYGAKTKQEKKFLSQAEAVRPVRPLPSASLC